MSAWLGNFRGFSAARWWGVVRKEFLQLRRDRVTFAMIVGIPIVQLALFGFAINTDPRHLPTAVISAEQSEFSRSLVAALRNSRYFAITEELPDEAAGREALAEGRVQFVLSIPADFSKRLLRGEKPAVLLEADATDPTATGMALGAVERIVASVASKDLRGPLAALLPGAPPFEIRVHRLYNPEGVTQYNIIPGLMGVILSMTLVMMTGLAMTRERERGTMENLLATPVRPLEVMSGKIVPYIAIGLLQATIILLAARFVFGVPFFGSIVAVYLAALLFIAANLTVGITLSSLAKNQLQAMQMTMFYFLPNMLLSGFMFPFAGMPAWAQWLASVLPLTHFNRLIRGIVLKGNGWAELWPSIWPILVFTVIVMAVAVRFYRRTLD
ncbi:ABC transporter permease [Solimonas variicoloris]|uniref:ABC transporter permease n=1 Tax=Solimonas variicoloris TaxID=254408 RepID=UPI00037D4C0C|nr:ABC transporter permease [Solimonas variicoloris]